MLRAWERGRPARKVKEPSLNGVEDLSIVAFLNHETAKQREIHEIYESRISRIILDFTEQSFSQRDSLRRLFFFSFIRVFLFPFAVL